MAANSDWLTVSHGRNSLISILEFRASLRYRSTRSRLENQSSAMSECIMKISILERFNADLCEAICYQNDELSGKVTVQSDFRGTQFLKWLEDSNMFVHPLDENHEWLQYHQLFRDILLHELARLCSPGEITKLHSIAGLWFSQNGLFEEALYHLMEANDMSAAINVVTQNRYSLMNDTQWARLEQWLNLFSTDVIETSIELYYEVQRAVGGPQHDAALRAAVEEVKPLFRKCRRCGDWLCEQTCWNGKAGMCKQCAPIAEEEESSIRAEHVRTQVTNDLFLDENRRMSAKGREAAAKCPDCGAPTLGKKFCPGCGKKLLAAGAFCGVCGARLSPGAKFCGECGAKQGEA